MSQRQVRRPGSVRALRSCRQGAVARPLKRLKPSTLRVVILIHQRSSSAASKLVRSWTRRGHRLQFRRALPCSRQTQAARPADCWPKGTRASYNRSPFEVAKTAKPVDQPRSTTLGGKQGDPTASRILMLKCRVLGCFLGFIRGKRAPWLVEKRKDMQILSFVC